MCTRYPIINRVSELKVHIELTRFVQPEKIEIDANERAVNEKSQYCFFVCTTFDSFLNDLRNPLTRTENFEHPSGNIMKELTEAELNSVAAGAGVARNSGGIACTLTGECNIGTHIKFCCYD